MKRRNSLVVSTALFLILGLVSNSLAASTLPTVGPNVNVIQPGQLNAGDQNKLQQNEPWIAIDPTDSSILAAGANDYRRSLFVDPRTIWMGYYRSTDGGNTWVNSLIPGFPGDNSPDGLASPARGLAGASDPALAFDLSGNLYFAFIAFNAAGFPDIPGPLRENGVFVAKYVSHGAQYSFTSTVAFNTASVGIFDDKEWVAVDARSGSPFSGQVYVCWTRFLGFAPAAQSLFGGDRIMFSFSADGGQTFSVPMIVSERGREGSILNQDCSIGVGPDGTVYVAWVTFKSDNLFGPTPDGILLAKSTDGGRTFTAPRTVATYNPVPRADRSGRDCCGLFGFRTPRGVELAVDPSGGVYIAFMADSNPAPNFDSAGNVLLANIDADVFVGISTDGGSTFTIKNITADNVQSGKDEDEIFPTISVASTTAGVRIDVAYYSDVNDSDQSDDNQISKALNAGGPGPQALLDVYYSFSTDGGATWASVRVTSESHNGNWPMFRGGTIPFHGDYIGIASNSDVVHIVWTDNRNVVFNDPDTTTARVEANNTGNRDQNIYTARLQF